MIDVNPEVVCQLIELAREFHGQEQVDLPDIEGEEMDDDWVESALANHVEDMGLQDFRSVINDLEPDQQIQIVALLWIGRGDYSTGEWDEVLEQARDEWTPKTAEYLLVHPLLAEHLEDGLEMFGLSCD